MRLSSDAGIGLLMVVLFSLTGFIGCDDNGEDSPVQTTSAIQTPTETPNVIEDIEITIGNISDQTGSSAIAMSIIDMALEDLVKHYNQENAINGVKLRVITYDGQSDPSKDIPGYEWLKEKGADLFFTSLGSVSQSLRSRLEADRMVLFTVDANEEELSPPGYIFCLSGLPREIGYTALEWIAENDWDYPANGPAKIGGAGWFFPYVESLLGGMEEYCDVHPDQFTWEGDFLTPIGTFTWNPEVVSLKDCDYVVPPVLLTTFVKGYREAGYNARFVCVDAQSSFLGTIGDAGLWDEIDETLFLRSSRWWNEEGPMINRTKQLLYEYHPNKATEIIRSGASYLVVNQVDPMFNIIAEAVHTVGPESFDSQALYDAAESFSTNIDGLVFSFSESKRTAVDYLAMFKAVGAEEDLIRADPDWIQIIRKP